MNLSLRPSAAEKLIKKGSVVSMRGWRAQHDSFFVKKWLGFLFGFGFFSFGFETQAAVAPPLLVLGRAGRICLVL